MARRLATNVKARQKNSCKFFGALDDPWIRGQLMVNWKFRRQNNWGNKDFRANICPSYNFCFNNQSTSWVTINIVPTNHITL